MKRVVVTGATGFIGRQALPSLLRRGFEVHAFHHRSDPVLIEGVHWHSVDLFQPSRVDALLHAIRPTHLLHLAWTTTGNYLTSVDNLRWVESSLALFLSFQRAGGKKVVTAGSCAEYTQVGVCQEGSDPFQASTLYGVCKRSLCQIVQAFAKTAGIEYAWGYLFCLYGPNEFSSRLVPSIICSLLQQKEIALSPGTQIRDYLFVEDAADALVSLLDSSHQGCFNIGSGSGISIRSLTEQIASRMHAPADLLKFGAVPLRPFDPAILVADISKLQSAIAWAPASTLEEGIDKTVAWWKQHLHQPA